MSAPFALTVVAAARALRRRDLSSEELTRSVLDRIAATEPAIHAYEAVFADAALASARSADRQLRAGDDLGPLHGIPVAVKDLVDIAGSPTRCGSAVRADAPPATRDAPVVTRLREAGAVILGKTVTHEFAGGVLSPPARNPWDPSRIPGGSSGGSAAAVAAGSCLAAIGTDTAGSIRVPAALTGTVGLKPTTGLVPTAGVFPLSWSLDTVGPMTRTVADAEIVLAALTGSAVPVPSADESAARLDGRRVGVPRPYFFDRMQPAVRAAVEQAISALADLGAEVVDVDWPDATAAMATGFVVCRPEMAAVHADALRQTPERYGDVLRSRLEAFSLFPAGGYLRALAVRRDLRRRADDLLASARLDVLALPTVVGTATPADATTIPLPDGDLPIHAGFTRLTMPFNTVGLPALSVPCGFDPLGLPIGLQLVGREGADADVLRIGRCYERATLPIRPASGPRPQAVALVGDRGGV